MYNAVHSSQESVELIATEFLALKNKKLIVLRSVVNTESHILYCTVHCEEKRRLTESKCLELRNVPDRFKLL